MIKRLFDISIALIGLICLAPLMLLIIFVLMLQGGKPVFGHQRIGQYGRPFACLKFRTMAVNAERMLAAYLAQNPAARHEWEESFKLSHDPRVTKLGYFLRKTSLDELPQLLNVLKGEMSLVGPRPIVEAETGKYRQAFQYYLKTKPGMTGLWQVNGRSNTPYRYRVFLDYYYATHKSLWLDICILVKTIPAVLGQRGAR